MKILEKIREEQEDLFKSSGIGNTFVCYKALKIIDKYAEHDPYDDDYQTDMDEAWKQKRKEN